MNIIARFKNNNKEYVYFLDSNNHIKYGYVEGNHICVELNEEEINLMNNLFQKISISKDKSNHIDICKIKYHQKNYQIIFDRISELKYILEITPYGLKEPLYSEVKDVLYFLNNTTMYDWKVINDGTIDDGIIGYEPKEIKIGRIIYNIMYPIYVFVVVTSIGRPEIFKLLDKENSNYYIDPLNSTASQRINFEKNFTKEKTSYEEIIIALNKNESLSQLYRDRILANASAIIENSDYIAKRKILERIETLEVIEAIGLQREKGFSTNITGAYDCSTNQITVFSEDSDYSIINHELFHMMTYGTTSLGSALYEGTNEIFQREYSNSMNENYIYFCEKNIVKLLIEIIGKEPFQILQFKCDPTAIIKELNNVINDDNMAIETLCLADTICSFNHQLSTLDKSSLEYKELLENIINIKLQITTNISKYYATKYKENINNDLVCSIYLNGINPYPQILYVEGTDVPVEIVEKAYFREDMINEMQDGIYRFDNRFSYEYISLDEAHKTGYIRTEVNEQGDNHYVSDDPNIIIMSDKVRIITERKPEERQNPIRITDENRYLNQFSKMLG